MPMEIRWVKQNKWCKGKDDEESEQVFVRVNKDNVFCFPFGVKVLKLMVCIFFSFFIVHDA
jgi:hypothetical protein